MSAIAPSHHSSLGAAAVAVARAIVGPFANLWTAMRNRREVATLLTADPAILRDIGLTPMDVQCALTEPLWRDPSARLLIWSIERRAASRAAARENIDGLGSPEAARFARLQERY
jgi:uncharacterized protein YjiS (DUF1127 family)